MCFGIPWKILSRKQTIIDPSGSISRIISAAVMFVVYLSITHAFSKKSKSKALKAAAKDNLSDGHLALVRIAILASSFNYPISLG